MNKKLVATLAVALLAAGSASPARATLTDRGCGMIYDDDLGPNGTTWLADATYAATELSDARVAEIIGGFPTPFPDGHVLVPEDFAKNSSGQYTGTMTWWGAVAWADQLTYSDLSGWRLPTVPLPAGGPCVGNNCTDSEMGHLYYTELGGAANSFSILFSSDPDVALFQFSSQIGTYWSGTDATADPLIGGPLFFTFINFSVPSAGLQGASGKSGAAGAWAVRDGDVVSDIDCDGVADGDDNCPNDLNSDQADTDGDGDGNACDDDDDNDGVLDNVPDNCPLTYNPDQTDDNGNGVGDACEDADDDGVLDDVDQCPDTPVDELAGDDGCAISQLCPCAQPEGDLWKNHGAYVRCVAHASGDFVAAGWITEAEKDAIVSEAGESVCGQKN